MKAKILLTLLLVLAVSACTLATQKPTEVLQPENPTPIVSQDNATETPEVIKTENIPVVPTVVSTQTLAPTPTLKKEWPPEPKILVADRRWPWELVFLPEGGLMFTERPGTSVIVRENEQKSLVVSGVQEVGEGGLLGMALHPDFIQNRWVFLYLTYNATGQTMNRVERYVFDEDQLSERIVILDGILGSQIHDGGRIGFGPDGKLYVTTGDAAHPQSAQDLNSLNGKILRLNDDGSVPEDNPFGSYVWTLGHRNPQGLAWDSQGRLWATEHGPSGSETGNDEINLIEPGKNYGWPLLRGMETRDGFTPPVIESGLGKTWAPSGAAIVEDMLYFAGLRGQALYRVPVDDVRLEKLEILYKNEFGRIRHVVVSPEGQLWIMTSNGGNSDQIIALPLP